MSNRYVVVEYFIGKNWEGITHGPIGGIIRYMAEVTEKSIQNFLGIVGVPSEFRTSTLLNTSRLY